MRLLTTGWAMASIMLAMSANVSSSKTRRFGQRAPCDIVPGSADTVQYVSVSGTQRNIGAVKLWTRNPGQVGYDETWRTDSNSFSWAGEIVVDAGGIPREFVSRRTLNGKLRNEETVKRVGDSVVVVRNGTRTAASGGAGALVPGLRSLPATLALASCTLRQPGAKLQTATLGRLSMREVARTHVADGSRRKLLRLYELDTDSSSGLGLLWFDEQGVFFASTDTDDPSELLLPRDWIVAQDQLLAAQARAASTRMRETAGSLGTRFSKIAFVHARIIDVERGQARKGMSFLVSNGRITIVSADSGFKAPPDAALVDVHGMSVLPGLWDLGQSFGHGAGASQSDQQSRGVLSRGVTSVLDLNADTLFTPIISQRIDAGEQTGPAMHGSCLIDGWYDDTVRGVVPRRIGERGQVRDSADVRGLIGACAKSGQRSVTFYPLLPANLAAFAVREAHARGLRVTGDALAGMSTSELLALGYDQIGHVGQALMPFVQSGNHDLGDWALERIGGGGTFVTKGAELARLDLQADSVRSLVRELTQRHTIVESSYCVYELIGRRGDSIVSAAAMAKLKEFGRLLRAAEVPVVPATDNACTIAHELEILSEVGYTNAELLRMSTRDAARAAGYNADSVAIAPGMVADLIICDGDPLSRIGDVANVSAVMRSGVLYANLEALRHQQPFAIPPRLAAQKADVEGETIRTIERERLHALVAGDTATAGRLHAGDFQLITPAGTTMSRQQYMSGIASGRLRYAAWTPESIAVRVNGSTAILRYRATLVMIVAGADTVKPYGHWHTDVYEKRDGRWQAVWSQATAIKNSTTSVPLAVMPPRQR